MKLICTLFAGALLAGCTTPTPAPQAITVPNKKPEAVRNSAMLFMTERGWQPMAADQFNLEFTKEMSAGSQFWLQEVGAQPAQHSIRLTFVEVPDGTRVIGNLSTILTRWGSPQRMPVNQPSRSIYVLECVRATALGEPLPPEPPPPPPTQSSYTGKGMNTAPMRKPTTN